MFTPKYPAPDIAPPRTAHLIPMPTGDAHAPACGCHHSPVAPVAPAVPAPVPVSRPAVQLTPGSLIVAAAGGTAVVLVVGAVLVSMLLAVAITGVSVAICAVVLRSLLNSQNNQR
ncbi:MULTISPECIES: SpdD protein [unclassified Streptomyces]|uniref:SpdD protein n=1 Tax=unclassified Streptomyces TaxID=2593676 RepID=UPI002E803BF7|nr:SpdD protein [Streptomyces sp. NBC_00562]WTD34492.1 SpdD protein [Streptomyces sp. NBC_01643]WUC20943.1 SpdD protein [Streptomyces sp. NBC_00562]